MQVQNKPSMGTIYNICKVRAGIMFPNVRFKLCHISSFLSNIAGDR